MNEKLVDSIDTYYAAVDLRAYPIIPSMEPVIEVLVQTHLKHFERVLADCDE